jgi:hypothetical protein
MAMLAAPAALAGLRALGLDERSARIGVGLAKKALPIAKSLFRSSRKKRSVRRHLAKAAPEIQKAVPGLAAAAEKYKLFDKLSKVNERNTGIGGSMLKKLAESAMV